MTKSDKRELLHIAIGISLVMVLVISGIIVSDHLNTLGDHRNSISSFVARSHADLISTSDLLMKIKTKCARKEAGTATCDDLYVEYKDEVFKTSKINAILPYKGETRTYRVGVVVENEKVELAAESCDLSANNRKCALGEAIESIFSRKSERVEILKAAIQKL